MTTLYRPVPITSAEQAEALPVGTLASASETYEDGATMHWAAVKVGAEWARTDAGGGLPVWFDAAMVDDVVPWSALVPIEAGEEYDDYGEYEPTGFVVYERTRLVTPWEITPEEET